MRKAYHFLIICFVSLVLCTACGYRLARLDNPMLEGVETIAVPYFKNKSYEPEAEAIFTYAFVNEFVESRRLQVVGQGTADVILYGTIKELEDETISYDRDDKALEYRVHAKLKLTLERRKNGEVLWARKSLNHTEEFPVTRGIVHSEASKRKAIKTLAADLAERVHDSIMQGF